jgi:hypothetical protein
VGSPGIALACDRPRLWDHPGLCARSRSGIVGSPQRLLSLPIGLAQFGSLPGHPLTGLLDRYWIALSRWLELLQSLATPYHRPSLRSSAIASARSWLIFSVLCYGTQLELIVSFNSLPAVCLNQLGDILSWHRYCGKQTRDCSSSLL